MTSTQPTSFVLSQRHLLGIEGLSPAEISGLPATDVRVLRAVLSIQGQILVFARQLPPSSPPAWTRAVKDATAVADHIAEFSLAALRTLAAQPH